jgi:hypothetical protein
MICKIAKCVQKYIIHQDTLNYAISNNTQQESFKKLFKKTNFYRLFILGIENVKTENTKSKNPFCKQMQKCKEKSYSKNCKLFKEQEID